jgi:tripartite-type tricarboxylate transporter receptor subunit TctC
MNLFKSGMLMALGVTTAMAWQVSDQAQSVEEFYKGHTITMIVSAPAGTLSDFLARQFADFYSQNIPGNPAIVVMNVAGAGGMVAAAQLQFNQPNDGTVIGFLQRNNLYLPLVEGNHDRFDPRELDWIGSLDQVRYTIVATADSPVQTAEEMFTTPMIIGATGFANENRTLAAMMNDYLGTKFEIVHGYTGREEVYLAMERGEADGWLPTIDGLVSGEPAQLIASGDLKVLMQLDWDNHPAFPDVPNFSDYVTDPKAKALIDFFILPFQAGRPLAVPAGVPEDRLAALRSAFETTVHDPAFIAHLEALDSAVDPVTGADIEAVIETLYATPEDVLDSARKFLLPQS